MYTPPPRVVRVLASLFPVPLVDYYYIIILLFDYYCSVIVIVYFSCFIVRLSLSPSSVVVVITILLCLLFVPAKRTGQRTVRVLVSFSVCLLVLLLYLLLFMKSASLLRFSLLVPVLVDAVLHGGGDLQRDVVLRVNSDIYLYNCIMCIIGKVHIIHIYVCI